VITQKSAVLIYFVAETSDHAKCTVGYAGDRKLNEGCIRRLLNGHCLYLLFGIVSACVTGIPGVRHQRVK